MGVEWPLTSIPFACTNFQEGSLLRTTTRRGSVLLACALLSSGISYAAGSLTFEQRLEAQRAIERIYFSHLVGSRRTFEQAVTRELLERKVRTYLKQSVALDQVWRTPVTAAALRAEAERIIRGSQFPDRLREIDAALGHDPYLFQETLVRATLAERLTRNFFNFDQTIHEAARTEAEALRAQLMDGSMEYTAEHPRRKVVETRLTLPPINLVPGDSTLPLDAMAAPRTGLSASPEEFEKLRQSAPSQVGETGALREETGAFVFNVLLESEPGLIRVASYTIPKTTWDAWWRDRSATFDESLAAAVADSGWDELADLAATAAPVCGKDDTWQNGVLDDMPGPMKGHAAVWTGSEMILWGGLNGGRYDPLTDTWRQVSYAGAPIAGFRQPAIWTGQEMITWGFSDGTSPSGGRYDPVTDTWSPLPTTGEPGIRVSHSAVWTGAEMIVWGGRFLNGGVDNSGGRYTPASDSWRPISLDNAPSARMGHTAVWSGGRMIVWGGIVPHSGSEERLGTGAIYDPSTDTWTATSASGAPSPRGEHTAIWTGGVMVVWGGREDGHGFDPSKTGGRFDPATNSWAPTTLAGAPEGRRAHTAVWTGTEMIVWGGSRSSGPNNPSWSGGWYDPVDDSWRPISSAPPSARSMDHSAIWTGSLMILWGGFNGWESATARGARYDPSSDTWTSTSLSAAGLPLPLTGPGFWTGTEMLVWALGGGRYDPTIDSWKTISTSDAPEYRLYHTAVWTGDELVVWGGWTGDQILVLGGRYDPVSDSWRPTSNAGAPEFRRDASAVWTGEEMIVFGGHVGWRLGTGGRYDPVSDTWLSLASLNAPDPVTGHTAVWTGREMIIWGGTTSTTWTDRGASYDPRLDTWTPLSSMPPGQGRASHSAAWTGREMLLFGGDYHPQSTAPRWSWIYDLAADRWSPGSSPGAPLQISTPVVWTGRHVLFSGGLIYDHTAGTWRTMSATPPERPPVARFDHAMAWTGSSLIVWGGYDFMAGGYAPNGGRYIFGQDADDDGDGLSDCAGDCDDTTASVWPGAPDVCDGRDNDCNGVVDDDSLGSDTDADGTPNVCDTCPELANPGQTNQFACIAEAQSGGACLAAVAQLTPAISEGSLTLHRDLAEIPDAISFEFNLVSCGGVNPVELLLNGQVIGTFVEPAESCECVPPPYRMSITDAALIGSLWNMSGGNTLGFRKPAVQYYPQVSGTFMGWVRVRLGSGQSQSQGPICIWDVAQAWDPAHSNCTRADQCPYFWTDRALDESLATTVQPVAEESLAATPFTSGTLPDSIDIASVPDGPMQLCIEPDQAPQLLAADAGGQIRRVNTGTGVSEPFGTAPAGVVDITHDRFQRRTFVQTTLDPGKDLLEIDLQTGKTARQSSLLVPPMAAIESVNRLLYGIESVSTGVRFIEMDFDSGSTRVVATLPAGTWNGLACDATSWLLLTARTSNGVSTLWRIEPLSGWSASHAPLEFQPTALEFGPDGLLYATRDTGSDTELYLVNPSTGATTLVGPMGAPGIVSLATVRNWPRACIEIIKQGEQTLTLNAPCNGPPAALAAIAPTTECTSQAGAVVRLDGSGSTDPDSSTGTNDGIQAFEWIESFGTPAEVALGSGEILDVLLPLGSHTITLRVTDTAGETSTDSRSVLVADTVGPTVVAGFQLVTPPPGGGRGGTLVVTYTVADACTARPNVAATLIGQGCEHEPADNGQIVQFVPAPQGCFVTSQYGVRTFTARSLLLRVIAGDGAENRTTVQSRLEGFGVDSDQDGVEDLLDCDSANGLAWSSPREAEDLRFAADGVSLSWTVPADPGAVAVAFDLLQADDAAAFAAGATCVASGQTAMQAEAAQTPASGAAFFYLVRAQNGCPGASGTGTLGAASSGAPRAARSCP